MLILQAQNRFKVPLGTKFYRVKAQAWDREAALQRETVMQKEFASPSKSHWQRRCTFKRHAKWLHLGPLWLWSWLIMSFALIVIIINIRTAVVAVVCFSDSAMMNGCGIWDPEQAAEEAAAAAAAVRPSRLTNPKHIQRPRVCTPCAQSDTFAILSSTSTHD